MTHTPWGDSETLREQRLSPGLRKSRSAVRDNQRQRLFAALVATVAEKGYESTTVGDLVDLSGVSRRSFYELFETKEDCFHGVLDSLMNDGIAVVRNSYDSAPGWEAGVQAGLASFMALLAAQPAAARLCFVDPYAAGPRAMAVVDAAFDEFSAALREGLEASPERAGMPAEIVRAIVGGLRKVIHTRLLAGREESLGELVEPLWEWGRSYRPPPAPLRRPGRRSREQAPAESPGRQGDTAERILRGLAAAAAERGYCDVTVGEIASRASVSLATFYSHFDNKEEAMLAALDSGSAQMLAAMLPAYRRGSDWPHMVRNGIAACFAFGVDEPAYSQLGAVEIYAAGPRALEQRDRILEGLQGLIQPGYEYEPEASSCAAEAIAGAIYAMIYDQVRAKGPRSLPEICPLATYVILCPFIGPEEACEVANGDGRRR